MYFRLLGSIDEHEMIAEGSGIRNLRYLTKKYGRGNWRKLKGIAEIETENGERGVAEIHWYECHGRGKYEFKFKDTSMNKSFLVCVQNDGYEGSLELCKIYEAMTTTEREQRSGMVRVIDETGEDYLFPERFFSAVTLPRETIERWPQHRDD